MHDPCTVAFEIKSPFKDKNNYRPSIITIWHVDPEKDGTDDSCGWFLRNRHGDKKVFEEIVKEFEFNFKHNYWFNKDGMPIFSTSGILLEMYSHACWIYFNRNRSKKMKFMRKYLIDILQFAENPTDSMHTQITSEMYYRTVEHDRSKVESRDERIRHFASVVYGDIMRKTRPWYKHPRWHIHHWRIQFHPWQNIKRRYWDKCCVCGKRGFKGAACGDWNGTKLWHMECNDANKMPGPPVHSK